MKKILPVLILLLCLSFTYSVNAADVTINSSRCFDELDGSVDDADGLSNGIFTVNGNLTITGSGSINYNDPGNACSNAGIPNDGAQPVSIVVSGNMEMQGGALINTENKFQAGAGGAITITVGGTYTMRTGAVISSSNLTATAGNKQGGAITINVTGDVNTETGSTIKANAHKGKAGDIVITGDNVTIDGNVLSQSNATGTGAVQGPGGGMISITAVHNLYINDNGVVSSRGLDPGADLVHLCGCAVRIWGLVESTGAGHAVPNSPVNHLNSTYRPDKPSNSTAGVEIWASNTLVIDNLDHKGQVNADLTLGAEKRAWIDIFARKNITILGKTTGTLFAIHSNVGGNNGQGGIITVKSLEGMVTASGLAIQSNGVGSGIRRGGPITVQSNTDLNLVGAKMESKGINLGGTIGLRSYNGNINMDATTGFNVSNNGAVTITACGTTGSPTITGAAAAPVPVASCGGAPFLQPYVVFCDCAPEEGPCVPLANCSESEVIVDENVTIDFEQADPANYYSGDADLKPYFSYDKSGATPDTWKAIFTMGNHKLTVKNGATVTTKWVGDGNHQYAPGIVINSNCGVEVENGGYIKVVSWQRAAGDITIDVAGAVVINGEVRNETTGTTGMPGYITIKSKTGINVGSTGRIFDFGVDGGGREITLVTCPDCETDGDIVIDGLVMAFAHAHTDEDLATRPRIKVVSIGGSVTINANTLEPLYDNSNMGILGGTLYDIYGGLLSWVRDNKKPGSVVVQAKNDIIVNGHGTDPTGAVYTSFGAIAAISDRSDAPGGKIDVRSLEGQIIASNRAFDVSGRNRLATNYAHINLAAYADITLTKSLATGNPVVDASSPSIGDKGGKNTLRSYNGSINIGPGVVVSAAVPAGAGTVQGTNWLTSCTGVSNSGTVVPADTNPGDDAGTCAPATVEALYIDCDLNGPGLPAYRTVTNTTVNQDNVQYAPPSVIAEVKAQFTVHPNPVRNIAHINYTLAKAAHVNLEVYNALGKKITVLVNAKQAAGTYHVQWNASGHAGGSYYIHLNADKDASVKNVYLLK